MDYSPVVPASMLGAGIALTNPSVGLMIVLGVIALVGFGAFFIRLRFRPGASAFEAVGTYKAKAVSAFDAVEAVQ